MASSEPDVRCAIRDGIHAEIIKSYQSWPPLHVFSGDHGFSPMLSVEMPYPSAYSTASVILCRDDIICRADNDCGPENRIAYEDPECIEQIILFIKAVSSATHRIWKPGTNIELEQWKDVKSWRANVESLPL